jgi:DNA-binding transcriptional MerR regulator
MLEGVTQRTYKLDELAQASGTSVRTIRYYVQRGLLPAPAFRGKDTAYDHEHLLRLRAIKKLQEAYLPLDAIASELARRTVTEIERLADGRDPVPVPRGSPAPAPSRPPEVIPPIKSSWRSWHRVEIAPGIELSVADDAPEDSRTLFERVLVVLEAIPNLKNVKKESE